MQNERETSASTVSVTEGLTRRRPALAASPPPLQCCEDLCLHKFAPALYTNVAAELHSFAASFVSGLSTTDTGDGAHSGAAGIATDESAYLVRVDAAWHDHCEAALTVRRVCTVLDRSYALATAGVAPLWEASLSAVRAHLDDSPQVVRRTVRGVLSLIAAERSGEAVNRRLLRDLLRMLSALGLYSCAFETPFLRETEAFYGAEAAQLVQSLDLPAYLRHAETRLHEESERAGTYLDAVTRKTLLTCCEAALIGRHVSSLLDKGFVPLMAACTERMSDLGRLYSLMARVSALDALRAALGAYVRAAGSQMVKDEAQEETLVSRLLEFKAALDGVHKTAFAWNETFGHTLKDAFEVRPQTVCVVGFLFSHLCPLPCRHV